MVPTDQNVATALAALRDLIREAQAGYAAAGRSLPAYRRRAARAAAYARLWGLRNCAIHLTAYRDLDLLAGSPGREIAERPPCPTNPDHGLTSLRVAATPEQAWCGAMYGCTAPGCHAAVSYPSPALRLQNAEQALDWLAREYPDLFRAGAPS